MIVLWCNGSTPDFGSVSLSSNLSRITNGLVDLFNLIINLIKKVV